MCYNFWAYPTPTKIWAQLLILISVLIREEIRVTQAWIRLLVTVVVLHVNKGMKKFWNTGKRKRRERVRNSWGMSAGKILLSNASDIRVDSLNLNNWIHWILTWSIIQIKKMSLKRRIYSKLRSHLEVVVLFHIPEEASRITWLTWVGKLTKWTCSLLARTTIWAYLTKICTVLGSNLTCLPLLSHPLIRLAAQTYMLSVVLSVVASLLITLVCKMKILAIELCYQIHLNHIPPKFPRIILWKEYSNLPCLIENHFYNLLLLVHI